MVASTARACETQATTRNVAPAVESGPRGSRAIHDQCAGVERGDTLGSGAAMLRNCNTLDLKDTHAMCKRKWNVWYSGEVVMSMSYAGSRKHENFNII